MVPTICILYECRNFWLSEVREERDPGELKAELMT